MKKHRPRPRRVKKRRTKKPAICEAPTTMASAAHGPRFYHGGAPGLRVGDEILPPSITGENDTLQKAEIMKRDGVFKADNAIFSDGKERYHSDRIYITPSLPVAMMYAIGHASGRGGCYLVEPVGEVTKDEYMLSEYEKGNMTCGRAIVREVIYVPMSLRQSVTTGARAAFQRGQMKWQQQ